MAWLHKPVLATEGKKGKTTGRLVSIVVLKERKPGKALKDAGGNPKSSGGSKGPAKCRWVI